jgi:hypothetical protein
MWGMRKEKLFLFLIGLVSQIGFYVFKKANYRLYQSILVEDSFVENFTSLNYFICSIVVFVCYKQILGSLKQWTLGLIFLFIALEEISYGQRLFAYELSEFWQNTNVQAESNLHNMPYVHEYLIPLAYLMISCVVLILTLNNRLKKKFDFPVFLSPYFLWIGVLLPIILITKVIELKAFWFIESIDIESSELILSFGFLFFLFYKMKAYNFKLN